MSHEGRNPPSLPGYFPKGGVADENPVEDESGSGGIESRSLGHGAHDLLPAIRGVQLPGGLAVTAQAPLAMQPFPLLEARGRDPGAHGPSLLEGRTRASGSPLVAPRRKEQRQGRQHRCPPTPSTEPSSHSRGSPVGIPDGIVSLVWVDGEIHGCRKSTRRLGFSIRCRSFEGGAWTRTVDRSPIVSKKIGCR